MGNEKLPKNLIIKCILEEIKGDKSKLTRKTFKDIKKFLAYINKRHAVNPPTNLGVWLYVKDSLHCTVIPGYLIPKLSEDVCLDWAWRISKE